MISMVSPSMFAALLVLTVLLSQSHLHPVCYHLSCCHLEVGCFFSPPLQVCTSLWSSTVTATLLWCHFVYRLAHLTNMPCFLESKWNRILVPDSPCLHLDEVMTVIDPAEGGAQRCQLDLNLKLLCMFGSPFGYQTSSTIFFLDECKNVSKMNVCATLLCRISLAQQIKADCKYARVQTHTRTVQDCQDS